MLNTAKFVAGAAAALLASLSTTAIAQSTYEPWEGTWETTYGEVRLVENGKYVYGDYADVGQIQGVLNEDKSVMRGVFTRTNGSVGYVEWVQSGDDGNRMFGRWKWKAQGLPQWNSERGGNVWRGDRRSASKPALRIFKSQGYASFFASQTSAFRGWAARSTKAPSSAASSGASSSAQAQNRSTKPWFDKIPVMRGSSVAPDWVELKLNRIGMGLDEARTYEIYGVAGLYAYCETPSGTRSLKPYYNQRNRVLDRPRGEARMGPIKFGDNAAKLRFKFDEDCLKQNGGRLSFQLQTNLAEKDTIRRLDEDFGYRGWKFYLEDLPTRVTLWNWGNSNDSIKMFRDSPTDFPFRHVERLDGRFLGERMYFYGELQLGFD